MSLISRIPPSRRGSAALLAVLIGSTGIQTTTAVASTLFEKFHPVSVSGLRMTTAAVVLLLIARPRFWRFAKADWISVVSYGVVTSLMNVFFYLAVERIPLGVAVTVEYLGAFTVAMIGVRKFRDGLFAMGALAGVVLIAGPTFGDTDLLGYLFAALASASMAGYTILSGKISSGTEASSGIRGLAVSIAVGAILWSPATAMAVPHMTMGDWGIAIFIGAVGLALAFSCDAMAVSLTSPATVGVFFSMDPVVSSLVGLGLLGQLLTTEAYVGIALIVISGAAVTWRANRSAAAIATHTEALKLIRTSGIPQVNRRDNGH
ncbi:DMT family transporter [Kocuria massiliensis]|uniref:EamA family transporter n=1 Tax=Kocuria massiliensis TaxID=1926282 RepID=UPI000A1CECE2|nr:EamA family transporter [Kocuria massiliensis]MCT1367981.1 EamA family transporter [Rothia sp. p3-SID1597]